MEFLFSLAGTLVSFERGGIATRTRLLDQSPRKQITDPSHPLYGKQCARVVRLSEVDGVPVLLEEVDFDLHHFPGIAALPLAGRSMSEVVQQHYRMHPQGADQSFRVYLLDGTRARVFGLPPNTPLLQVDRTLHFPLIEAAVFARMYCRTDRLTFSQHLQGNQHA